jgi:hypothetical protein
VRTQEIRKPGPIRGREVYFYHRATLAAGEEAALPLESAAGDDVLVVVLS